jgi:hypothetical protein
MATDVTTINRLPVVDELRQALGEQTVSPATLQQGGQVSDNTEKGRKNMDSGGSGPGGVNQANPNTPLVETSQMRASRLVNSV